MGPEPSTPVTVRAGPEYRFWLHAHEFENESLGARGESEDGLPFPAVMYDPNELTAKL